MKAPIYTLDGRHCYPTRQRALRLGLVALLLRLEGVLVAQLPAPALAVPRAQKIELSNKWRCRQCVVLREIE